MARIKLNFAASLQFKFPLQVPSRDAPITRGAPFEWNLFKQLN